jgi:hypothetical protein
MRSLHSVQNGNIVFVRQYVSSQKILNEFQQNLVLTMYTKACQMNLILVRIDQILHPIHMKFLSLTNFLRNGSSYKTTGT